MTMKYFFAIGTVLSSVLGVAVVDAAALQPAGTVDSPINVVATNYTDAEGTLLQGFLSLPGGHANANGDNDHEEHDDHDDSHEHDGEEHERNLEDPVPTAVNGDTYPAVIILHDQSGPDDYEKQRATIFAQHHNYVGFAADIFGYFTEQPPADAGWAARAPFLSQFMGNATFFGMRVQAAIDYVQSLPQVDPTKVAIVGYCMGGTGVVQYLNTHGASHPSRTSLAGAVSIHPSLNADVMSGPKNADIDVPSLFLTGGADFLTAPASMATLENDMTEHSPADGSVPWETVRYAKIGHAFSNWHAEQGYDARADARSWHSLLEFLGEEFGLEDYEDVAPQEVSVERVVYVDAEDGGYPLTGYVAVPDGLADGDVVPVVILLPHDMDATGAGTYEKQRATQVATDSGFIGFVADMYSSNITDTTTSADLQKAYHDDVDKGDKYLSRIRAAITHVKTMDHVDPANMALLGFGFGGSGALYYAVGEVDEGVKAIASFHGEMDKVADAVAKVMSSAMEGAGGGGAGGTANWGGVGGSAGGTASWGGDDGGDGASPDSDADSDGDLTFEWTPDEGGTRRLQGDATGPRILVQSGVAADDMDDVIALENVLVLLEANYELTRFSDTGKDFTVWDAPTYNARAAARSFDQLNTVLFEVFDAVPPKKLMSEEGVPAPTEAVATTPTMATPVADPTATKSPVAAPHNDHDHAEGDNDHDSSASLVGGTSVVGFMFATVLLVGTLML